MLERGVVGELKQLRQDFPLNRAMPSMRCVGYRQAWRFLDRELTFSDLREQGIAATRQLAKRQMTWMRAMRDRVDFDCLDPKLAERVLDFLQTALRTLSWP
jgi:tRNA dimethylallyltransferase